MCSSTSRENAASDPFSWYSRSSRQSSIAFHLQLSHGPDSGKSDTWALFQKSSLRGWSLRLRSYSSLTNLRSFDSRLSGPKSAVLIHFQSDSIVHHFTQPALHLLFDRRKR